jgi:hypothetical protein
MADKIHTFVRTLKKRTEEGKVVWEPTVDEGIYQAAFPHHTVKIWIRDSREGAGQDIVVALLNKEGIVVEEIDDPTLSGGGYVDAFRDLHKVYRLARRRAMGVDAALDEIISSLGPDNDEAPSPGNRRITDDDVPF